MEAIHKILKLLAGLLFFLTIILAVVSVVHKPIPGEAYIGDFGTMPYDENWILTMKDRTETITLPHVVPDSFGKQIRISNTLPEDLQDGMRLCLRANMQDVRVFVDGRLRQDYSSEGLKYFGYYPPSAYLMVDLGAEDAGKEIVVEYLIKNKGTLRQMNIGYGNNAWFQVIYGNLAEVIAAVLMIILGSAAIAAYLLFRRRLSANKSVLFLGQTIIMMGIWILSESGMRQLIFGVPSATNLFCYLSLEAMTVYILFYFDEVQGKCHHRVYFVLEGLLLFQILINLLTAVLGIAEQHDTLVFYHAWLVIDILVTVALIIRDILCGRIRKYMVTAAGMLLFLIFTVVELAFYYFNSFYSPGLFLCIGLVLMLSATMLQTLQDAFRKERENTDHLRKATLATIETIAGSIDAKDEYTGGHSERVAYYATILAEAVAGEYGLTSEDIVRIRYIALMHDIGKIGVPDMILNKAGRLTEDEYQLMKRHATIGDALLSEIETIEGLSDGVRHHHERFDGRGYPDELEGEEIPLIARILCLADCYDAMTSNRVYRTRLSDEQVRREIVKCSGSQFDPHLAEVFCRLMDEGKIHARTQNGYEIKEDGEVHRSSLLRHLLVEDMTGGKHCISHPSFVRMISYVIKMAEKRGRSLSITLLGVSPREEGASEEQRQEAGELLKKQIEGQMDSSDISVEYSASHRLVVWFDCSKEEAMEKIVRIREGLGDRLELTVEEIEDSGITAAE